MLLRAQATRRINHNPSQRSASEAGAVNLSGILLLLVVASILFASFKLLPPYIDNYRLQDSLESIARNATYSSRMGEAEIRSQVLSEASEIGIPLEPKQVSVQRSGAAVSIAVHYVITVDLLVRQIDLTFDPAAGNRNIMAR